MSRYLAYSLTFLILFSCGTNKIRLGKKHVHSKITTEQEIEPVNSSFNNEQPEAVSSLEYSTRNIDSIGSETNDHQKVHAELDFEPDEIYLDQKETNQIDSTSRVKEEYPGFNKRRNRGQMFRIMLGVLFIVAGVLFAVGVSCSHPFLFVCL